MTDPMLKDLAGNAPAAVAVIVVVVIFMKFIRSMMLDHRAMANEFNKSLRCMNEESKKRADECHAAHGRCMASLNQSVSTLERHTRALEKTQWHGPHGPHEQHTN